VDARSEKPVIRIDVGHLSPTQTVAYVERVAAHYRAQAQQSDQYPPESALVPPARVEEQAPVLTIIGFVAALLCILAALFGGMFR
jgi:hypothetical protein